MNKYIKKFIENTSKPYTKNDYFYMAILNLLTCCLISYALTNASVFMDGYFYSHYINFSILLIISDMLLLYNIRGYIKCLN